MLDWEDYAKLFDDRRLTGLHDVGYTKRSLLKHWECEYKTAFAAAAVATTAGAKAATLETGFAQFV
jgi:hypothetical protein